MRRFWLHRLEDASGVSGTGVVAEGVLFSNGKCVISWLTAHTSVAVYDDLATLEAIHGHGGRTVIRWSDRESRTIPASSSFDETCPACDATPLTDRCPFRCHR